jgi:hypothetical protein
MHLMVYLSRTLETDHTAIFFILSNFEMKAEIYLFHRFYEYGTFLHHKQMKNCLSWNHFRPKWNIWFYYFRLAKRYLSSRTKIDVLFGTKGFHERQYFVRLWCRLSILGYHRNYKKKYISSFISVRKNRCVISEACWYHNGQWDNEQWNPAYGSYKDTLGMTSTGYHKSSIPRQKLADLSYDDDSNTTNNSKIESDSITV